MNQNTQAAPTKGRQPTPAPVINRVMLLEGRRDATEMVFAQRATLKLPNGLTQVITNLKKLAEGRPPSSAAGIAEVVELLESQQ